MTGFDLATAIAGGIALLMGVAHFALALKRPSQLWERWSIRDVFHNFDYRSYNSRQFLSEGALILTIGLLMIWEALT
jgi:hypothetical protein